MTSDPTRRATFVLSELEKKLLIRIADRLPRWVLPDHLTLFGMAGSVLVTTAYLMSNHAVWWLWIANLGFVINWFGDSLDGTLARVRHHERPRYGFYVDHVLDVVGVLFLVAGLALGGHVSGAAGAGFLLAYYLLMIEIALATHAVGTFRISYWKFGPTELRILLAIGTLQLMRSDVVTIAGQQVLLFDLGMTVGAIGLVVTCVASILTNTRALYRAEPLPPEP